MRLTTSSVRGRGREFFEATVNAIVEKNGYFTRSFWMLEHMDASGCAGALSAGEDDGWDQIR